MKKIILSILALFIWSAGNSTVAAQNLPSEGDKTFEVQVSPFSASPVSFDQFRLRSFQSADMAYRLRGNILFDSERFGENRRDSQFQIQLAPGIEWHAFQNNRISLYYGAELPILYNTTRSQINEDRTDKNVNSSGFFGIGLNAIAGMDVHFLQRLYTGIEIGYGFEMFSYLDGEIDGQTVSNDRRDVSLGNFFYPRFRLGVRF